MSDNDLQFNVLAEQAASAGYGLRVNKYHPERYDIYALGTQTEHVAYDISYQKLLDELALIQKTQ